MKRNKEPLLLRSLQLERQILVERSFEVAKSVTSEVGLERVSGEEECMVMIGPHRFPHSAFYASIDSEVMPGKRRGSLSLLQMYLSGGEGSSSDTKKDPGTTNSSNNEETSASSRIKELLSKNPGLVQLLNGTMSFNKKRISTAPSKSRAIYFRLEEGEKYYIFPSNASVERMFKANNNDKSDLIVSFNPLIASEFPLRMVIRDATEGLADLLSSWTRDPVLSFSEFRPRIGQLSNIPYKELLFPCHPPFDVSLDALTRQIKSIAENGIKTKVRHRKIKNEVSINNADVDVMTTKSTNNNLKGGDVKKNKGKGLRKQKPSLESSESIEVIPALVAITPRTPPPQDGRHCGHCGARSTPMWRRGPEGPSTLCNACGVKWKHGKLGHESTTPISSNKISPPAARRAKSEETLLTKTEPDNSSKVYEPTSPNPTISHFAPIKKRKYTPNSNNTSNNVQSSTN